MKLPITIDPRYHDAVLFDLDGALTCDVPMFGATVDLAQVAGHRGRCRCVFVEPAVSAGIEGRRSRRPLRRLHRRCRWRAREARKAQSRCASGGPSRLGVRPRRCVIIENSAAGVAAGRDEGFALVIGIDGTGTTDDLAHHGADVVLADLADVAVRTGDTRISESRMRSSPMVS